MKISSGIQNCQYGQAEPTWIRHLACGLWIPSTRLDSAPCAAQSMRQFETRWRMAVLTPGRPAALTKELRRDIESRRFYQNQGVSAPIRVLAEELEAKKPSFRMAFKWLPKRDFKRTSQREAAQLLESMYKRHGRHTLISIGEQLPGIKPPATPVYRNIVKEALKIKVFLNDDLERSYASAAQQFKVSRARISQLMKIIENVPEDFITKMAESDDQNMLKRFSGKVLYRIGRLEQKERRAFIKELMPQQPSSADLAQANSRV